MNWFFSPIRTQRFRTAFLFLGVLIVSASFGLFLSASETSIVRVDEDLARYWRTTYDIVVRPPGYRSEVEAEYQLVQPNYLLGIPGGITFAQYEAIQSIPGVEVVAPVAVVGAFVHPLDLILSDSLPPGIFGTQCTVEEDDGARIFVHTEKPSYWYVGPEEKVLEEIPPDERERLGPGGTPFCWFEIFGLMVGVDPEAEEALVGLSQTVVFGDYLHKVPVLPFRTDEILPGRIFPGISKTGAYSVSVLVNSTPYISFTISGEVAQLEIPPEVKGIQNILEKGGADFLDNLPRQRVVARRSAGTKELYSSLVERIKSSTLLLWFDPTAIKMSPVQYRQTMFSSVQRDLVLEAIPVDRSPFEGIQQPLELILQRYQTTEPGFRKPVQPSGPLHSFGYFVVGVFNTEKLGLPEELAAVPLETYFPPKAILLYDENGAPVEPKTLRPTTDPYGYFLPPPFLLTTMEAARAIAGDDSISAIRVRVAGVDRFSPEAQSRIEAVAAEIVNRTGLDVDIIVGSSPRPVLVHIPGTGYVEEYWVQKGVSLTTHREVHRANYLLFATMLFVCALFIFNTTSTTVAGRIQEFGLLKALGWRGSDLTALVLTEGLLIGALGGALGTVLALGLAKALGLVFPLGRALLILPTGILLCLAGFALPALRAGRVSPMVALRQGEQTWRGRVPRWLGVVGRSLLRRRMRSLLVAGVMGAGAGMLALLVSLLVGMRGYLALTLLGRYILVRVSGYHWGMVGVMMAVGALATADVLLAGVLERRREIGVLKALGWRTGAVARLFLLEGAMLGLLGGLAGTALGLAVYLGLYRSVGIGLLWAVLAGLGVPTLVGALAAAYPARVAAAVAPAEAVRGE